MKSQLDKVKPHISAVIIFVLIALLYTNPLLQNKVLKPSDIRMWEAAAKEILDYREETGKEALWTNSMFSGMLSPTTSAPPWRLAIRKVTSSE